MKRDLADACYWLLFVIAAGFSFGMAQYFGQDTARAALILLLKAVHR